MKHLKKFEKFDQALIDQLLDKIAEFGIDSLTKDEKEYLSNPDGVKLQSTSDTEATIHIDSSSQDTHPQETNFTNIKCCLEIAIPGASDDIIANVTIIKNEDNYEINIISDNFIINIPDKYVVDFDDTEKQMEIITPKIEICISQCNGSIEHIQPKVKEVLINAFSNNSYTYVDNEPWYFDVYVSRGEESMIALSRDGVTLDDRLCTSKLANNIIDRLSRAGIYVGVELAEAMWKVEDSSRSKKNIIKAMEREGFIYSPEIFD